MSSSDKIQSSILFNPFSEVNYQIEVTTDITQKKSKFFTGYDLNNQIDVIHTLKYFFLSLLLYDKISITPEIFLKLTKIFNAEDLNTLCQNNVFELLDDTVLSLCLFEKNRDSFNLNIVLMAHSTGKITNGIEWLDERLLEIIEKDKVNTMLISLQKNYKNIYSENITKVVKKEILYDLNNLNLSNSLKNNYSDLSDIKRNDVIEILRIANLNKYLYYSTLINSDNLVLEASIKSLMMNKLSPLFNNEKFFIDNFNNEFLNNLKIPDFTYLFRTKILRITDLLEFRNDYNGDKFRKLLKDINYSSEELHMIFLKTRKDISQNIFIKMIRFFTSNVLGMINLPVGLAASAIDSFVIDKILNKWHPSIYLDEVLSQRIDNLIEADKNKIKREFILRKNPNIGRNDNCPCGRNSKFKNCCGKNF